MVDDFILILLMEGILVSIDRVHDQMHMIWKTLIMILKVIINLHEIISLLIRVHLHLEKNTVQIIFSEFVATTSEKVI